MPPYQIWAGIRYLQPDLLLASVDMPLQEYSMSASLPLRSGCTGGLTAQNPLYSRRPPGLSFPIDRASHIPRRSRHRCCAMTNTVPLKADSTLKSMPRKRTFTTQYTCSTGQLSGAGGFGNGQSSTSSILQVGRFHWPMPQPSSADRTCMRPGAFRKAAWKSSMDVSLDINTMFELPDSS
jgi:hypothetical protein